jgi:hypothetical protein
MDSGPTLGTVESVTVGATGTSDASVLLQANAPVLGANNELPDGAIVDAGSSHAGDAGDGGDGGDAALPSVRIEQVTAGGDTAGGFWIVGHDANSTDPDAGACRFLGLTNNVQPPAQPIPFVPDDSLPVLNTPLSFFVGRVDGQLVLGTLRIRLAQQAALQVLPVAPDLVPTPARLQIPITGTPSLLIYGLTPKGDLSILRLNFDDAGTASLDDSFGDGGVATVPMPAMAELGSVGLLDDRYFASVRLHLATSTPAVLLRLSNMP